MIIWGGKTKLRNIEQKRTKAIWQTFEGHNILCNGFKAKCRAGFFAFRRQFRFVLSFRRCETLSIARNLYSYNNYICRTHVRTCVRAAMSDGTDAIECVPPADLYRFGGDVRNPNNRVKVAAIILR